MVEKKLLRSWSGNKSTGWAILQVASIITVIITAILFHNKVSEDSYVRAQDLVEQHSITSIDVSHPEVNSKLDRLLFEQQIIGHKLDSLIYRLQK